MVCGTCQLDHKRIFHLIVGLALGLAQAPAGNSSPAMYLMLLCASRIQAESSHDSRADKHRYRNGKNGAVKGLGLLCGWHWCNDTKMRL